MLKKDVSTIFNSLVKFGIKPPCDTKDKAACQTLVSEFYEKYQNLKDDEVHELTEKIPLLPHWPTFEEIDGILADYRKEQLSKQFGVHGNGGRWSDPICEAALGHKPPLGETWVLAMAKKAAKRWFPDASREFVEHNQLVLCAQCERDYLCDTCNGKSLKECKTGGHMGFLTIEPHSGLCMELIDCVPCGKAYVPTKEEE